MYLMRKHVHWHMQNAETPNIVIVPQLTLLSHQEHALANDKLLVQTAIMTAEKPFVATQSASNTWPQ